MCLMAAILQAFLAHESPRKIFQAWAAVIPTSSPILENDNPESRNLNIFVKSFSLSLETFVETILPLLAASLMFSACVPRKR
jgi:hypothetical protein